MRPTRTPAGWASSACLRFPGQYADSETGLYYNYFRDYDSETGRYKESDPIGLGGGINTYSYAYNFPTEFIDPYGLDVYRGSNNYYGDVPPASGCQRAIFSGRYIVGWVTCPESSPSAPVASARSYCPATSNSQSFDNGGNAGDPGFDWPGFIWEMVKPDWTMAIGPIGKAGKFWKGLKAYRQATRTNGLAGKAKRFYQWDHTHGDVEVYDKLGKYLGTADAHTGEMVKPPVTGRSIDIE